jgi:hypothetical protein
LIRTGWDLFVVVPTGDDGCLAGLGRVHQAVFVVDAARPESGQVVPEDLRLSDAWSVGIAFDIGDQ